MNNTTQHAENIHHTSDESDTQHGAASVKTLPIYKAHDPRRKSLFLTALLSVMPGLGHAYVGYHQRAFMHFLIFWSTVSIVASSQLNALMPLLGSFIAFFWFFNQIDAVRRATFYNLALEGLQDMPLPEEMATPSLGGSYVGGVALLLGGTLALSNTLFDLPLDWLADWWPMAPIAFGAYLVYRARKDEVQ